MKGQGKKRTEEQAKAEAKRSKALREAMARLEALETQIRLIEIRQNRGGRWKPS